RGGAGPAFGGWCRGLTTMSKVASRDPDTTAHLELRALEKMIRALCRHGELLVRGARARGALESREGEFQLRAFEERRSEAGRLLDDAGTEPRSMRIGRLERLAEALECSRDYFKKL